MELIDTEYIDRGACRGNASRCVENRNNRNSREALLNMLIGVDLACLSEAWRTLFERLSVMKEVKWRSVERLEVLVAGIDAVVASDD